MASKFIEVASVQFVHCLIVRPESSHVNLYKLSVSVYRKALAMSTSLSERKLRLRPIEIDISTVCTISQLFASGVVGS